MTEKLEQLRMRKFGCVMLKRLYICYYKSCMTVPLSSYTTNEYRNENSRKVQPANHVKNFVSVCSV